MAQIAITALSLPYREQTHWTVGGSFVASLVLGLLSVYFACIVQVQLGNLHTSVEVRKWLITERLEAWRLVLGWLVSSLDLKSHDQEPHNLEAPQESQLPNNSLESLLQEFRSKHIPSFHSALLLVAPLQLLNWSVAWLLIGIGIYYGLIFTRNLGEMHGQNSNLAILLVYIISAAGALASFGLPNLYKLAEVSEWVDEHHAILEQRLHEAKARDERGRDANLSSQTLHRSQERLHDREVGSRLSSQVNREFVDGRNAAAPGATTATVRSDGSHETANIAGEVQPATIQFDDRDSSEQSDAASLPGEYATNHESLHRCHDGPALKTDQSDDGHSLN